MHVSADDGTVSGSPAFSSASHFPLLSALELAAKKILNNSTSCATLLVTVMMLFLSSALCPSFPVAPYPSSNMYGLGFGHADLGC
jgi:hypothetical protein